MIDHVSSENSVFVGIRKGDYEKEAKHYGYFDNEYYIRAMSYISERIDNPVFYIFSNDIKWCILRCLSSNKIYSTQRGLGRQVQLEFGFYLL